MAVSPICWFKSIINPPNHNLDTIHPWTPGSGSRFRPWLALSHQQPLSSKHLRFLSCEMMGFNKKLLGSFLRTFLGSKVLSKVPYFRSVHSKVILVKEEMLNCNFCILRMYLNTPKVHRRNTRPQWYAGKHLSKGPLVEHPPLCSQWRNSAEWTSGAGHVNLFKLTCVIGTWCKRC